MKIHDHTGLRDQPLINKRGVLRRTLTGLAAALLVGTAPLAGAVISPAQAQVQVDLTTEFHSALSPYGQWRHVARWGDVWVPGHVGQGWRPYTVGHWVYTDNWGWYWVSATPEAEWGWIVYHYGRWVIEPGVGWVWVPDTHWAPAWVLWRRGEHHLGWAPLPPEQLVVEYRTYPQAWIFVPAHEFTSADVATVVLPPHEVDVAFRETVVVNETVVEHNRVAVNPGIEPGIVAAEVGRPIHAYTVRPEVIAGTAAVANAVEVGPQELRNRQHFHPQVALHATSAELRPVQTIPKPQKLQANERGRLGNHPPRAAEVTPQGNHAQNPQNAMRGPAPGPSVGNRQNENQPQNAMRGPAHGPNATNRQTQNQPQNAMRGPAGNMAEHNAAQGATGSREEHNARSGPEHGRIGRTSQQAAGSQKTPRGSGHGQAANQTEHHALPGPEHGPAVHHAQQRANNGTAAVNHAGHAVNHAEHNALRTPEHGLAGTGREHAGPQHPARGPEHSALGPNRQSRRPQTASGPRGFGTNGEARHLYNSVRPQQRGPSPSAGALHHGALHPGALHPGAAAIEHRPGAERGGFHAPGGPGHAAAAHAAIPGPRPGRQMAGPAGGPAGGPQGHHGGPGGGRHGGAGGPP